MCRLIDFQREKHEKFDMLYDKFKLATLFFFFFTKINDIHSFKLIEYIDTMQIR